MAELIKRKGTGGKARYYVRYVDADGRRKMRATKQPDEKSARRYIVELEARIARGIIGIPEPTPEEKARQSITVRELGERFLEEYAPPRLKDVEEYRTQARSVLKVRIYPRIGARTAASVTTADVDALVQRLVGEGRAHNSVLGTLRVLSRVYGWGRKVGAIDCSSPVVGCERPRATPSLEYLDAAEVGRLLKHAEEHAADYDVGFFPLVATAIYTGMRKGELWGLRWRDVHLGGSSPRVDVNRSYTGLPKSGKTRHLPAHPSLVPILRAWQKQCPATVDALVFPIKGMRGWRMGKRDETLGLPVALKAAECRVPSKPWHALRHTFASHFMMVGGNILSLQKLLGHADISMTMIYAHLAPDYLRAEVTRLAFPAPVADNVASLDAARAHRAVDRNPHMEANAL